MSYQQCLGFFICLLNDKWVSCPAAAQKDKQLCILNSEHATVFSSSSLLSYNFHPPSKPLHAAEVHFRASEGHMLARCSHEGQPVPDLYHLALLQQESRGGFGGLCLKFLDHQPSVTWLGILWEPKIVCNSLL